MAARWAAAISTNHRRTYQPAHALRVDEDIAPYKPRAGNKPRPYEKTESVL